MSANAMRNLYLFIKIFAKALMALMACFIINLSMPIVLAQPLVFERSTLLSRGVNFGGWLWEPSTHTTHYNNTKISDKDFALLQKLGVTHIRLPIPPSFLFEDLDVSKSNEAHFVFLEHFVTVAANHNIAVVLDLHPSDPVEYKRSFPEAKFFWKVIATRFAHYPANVFYETFNEPKINSPKEWRVFQTNIVEAIRKVDSQHTLIVDGLYQAYYTGFSTLIPLEDANIIYSFHYYNPMAFTHQGANWVEPFSQLHGIHYPTDAKTLQNFGLSLPGYNHNKVFMEALSRTYNKAIIQKELEEPVRFSNKYNVPIYCGEMGVYNKKTPYPDRIIWYQDVMEGLKKHQIGFALWNYIGQDFALDLPIFAQF